MDQILFNILHLHVHFTYFLWTNFMYLIGI